MQYKDYIWPHNPRTYTISYERKVAVHKVPFGRYAMQDLGLGRRVMRGEGEFYGEGAYEEFKKLASVFYHGGPGCSSTRCGKVPTPTLWSSRWPRSPGRIM